MRLAWHGSKRPEEGSIFGGMFDPGCNARPISQSHWLVPRSSAAARLLYAGRDRHLSAVVRNRRAEPDISKGHCGRIGGVGNDELRSRVQTRQMIGSNSTFARWAAPSAEMAHLLLATVQPSHGLALELTAGCDTSRVTSLDAVTSS
jgi:hypothetical protein